MQGMQGENIYFLHECISYSLFPVPYSLFPIPYSLSIYIGAINLMQDLMLFLSKSLLSWLLIQFCLTLVFIWYLRSYQSIAVADEQLPKTAVILCLRGADPFLPNCVRSLLRQNYPKYDLKIVVDSQEDPAFKIATEAIAEIGASNAQITTLKAVRKNCSLKCSSLLQAISELDDSYQVLALVDADIVPHPNFLRELVTPLIDGKVGVTTGNRWYVPTGNYWGSLVRYAGNISSVVQMFLFGVPWGGTLAIKTEVLHRTELLNKWEQAFTNDMLIPKFLKQHGLKVKFVPSLLMVNREECELPRLLDHLKRLLLCARLYHPQWLSIVGETISSILFPTLYLMLILASFLEGKWYIAGLLFTAYTFYTIGLLLVMLLLEVNVQEMFNYQGQPPTKFSLTTLLKMFIAIPLTQWVYGLAILSSLFMSTVTWRNVSYRIDSPWQIRLLEYHPYKWLDQPNEQKMSL
jgi:cellulose synthase/poly-beta-1,6-N-acetylglucosamine synthase-like glycosyltransferase